MTCDIYVTHNMSNKVQSKPKFLLRKYNVYCVEALKKQVPQKRF